jgi:hypothetical protein
VGLVDTCVFPVGLCHYEDSILDSEKEGNPYGCDFNRDDFLFDSVLHHFVSLLGVLALPCKRVDFQEPRSPDRGFPF